MSSMSQYYTPIELFLSCKNLRRADLLSKSDPYIVVLEGSSVLGKTETIVDDQDPNFSKSVSVRYEFERHQQLTFSVRDEDDSGNYDDLGTVSANLGEIVCAEPSVGIERRLNENGKATGATITIRAVQHDESSKEWLTFKCSAKKLDKMDWFGKSDPYFEIWSDSMIYRSETKLKTLNPVWNASRFARVMLSGKDFLVKVYDWDKHGENDFIGQFTIPDLSLVENGSRFPVINPKKNYSSKKPNSGTFVFDKYGIILKKTFLDYIQSGMRLNFACAIDFTGSNGEPSSSTSLHFRSNDARNQYTDAIAPVITIIQDYDDDKVFPCYGFGAKVNGTVSHCFPLCVRENRADMRSLDDILYNYWECISVVQLWGPTYFAPVIRQTIQRCSEASTTKQASRLEYQVLLIITDGAITDMQQTMVEIEKAQSLPMSIIIVGVGNADFDSMEELDGDGGETSFSKIRDCVQFVSYQEVAQLYHGGGDLAQRFFGVKELLASKLLEELPKQVEEYIELKMLEW